MFLFSCFITLDINFSCKHKKGILDALVRSSAYELYQMCTLGSLTGPVTNIATHCSEDRSVGRPQRMPHRCTPLRGTGLYNHRSFVVGFCLVRALSQLSSSTLTLCLADKSVGRPQILLHRCTGIPSRHGLASTELLSMTLGLVRAPSQLPSYDANFVDRGLCAHAYKLD